MRPRVASSVVYLMTVVRSRPVTFGYGRVRGVATSCVAILMFFKDGVDCKAVRADDRHEVENTVVDTGVRGAALAHDFFLWTSSAMRGII